MNKNKELRFALLKLIIFPIICGLILFLCYTKLYGHTAPFDYKNTADYHSDILDSVSDYNFVRFENDIIYIESPEAYIDFRGMDLFASKVIFNYSDFYNCSSIMCYYDTGNGFNDENCHYLKRIPYEISTNLMKNVSGIRLSFINAGEGAYIKLADITLENGVKKYSHRWLFTAVNLLILYLILIFTILKVAGSRGNLLNFVLKTTIIAVAAGLSSRTFFFLDTAASILVIILTASLSLSVWMFNPIDSKKNDKAFYICFYIFCFLLYLTFAFFIPFHGGDDEWMRFDIPKFIYENGHLPTGYEEEIRNSIWGFSYGFAPALASIISAFFMKLASGFTQENFLYVAARFTSILSVLGAGIFAKQIGERFFSPLFTKLFVVSVTLLPQVAFIAGYVNNDSFGIFCVFFTSYCLIICAEKEYSLKSLIILGIACGLTALSYYNACAIILVGIFFLTVSLVKSDKLQNKVSLYFRSFLIVLGVALLVAGWAYIRNAIIYNGDFTGLIAQRECGQMYAQEAFKPSNRITLASLGVSLKEMLFDRKWLLTTAESFVGYFGLLTVKINYLSYYILWSVFGLGLFFNILIRKKSLGLQKLFTISMVLLFIIVLGMTMFYSYFVDFQALGRYLMPALIAISFLIYFGWQKFALLLSPAFRRLIPSLIMGIYVIIVFAALFLTMLNPENVSVLLA